MGDVRQKGFSGEGGGPSEGYAVVISGKNQNRGKKAHQDGEEGCPRVGGASPKARRGSTMGIRTKGKTLRHWQEGKNRRGARKKQKRGVPETNNKTCRGKKGGRKY